MKVMNTVHKGSCKTRSKYCNFSSQGMHPHRTRHRFYIGYSGPDTSTGGVDVSLAVTLPLGHGYPGPTPLLQSVGSAASTPLATADGPPIKSPREVCGVNLR